MSDQSSAAPETTLPNQSDDKSNGAVWVGFDLGGTKMLATVYDGQFRKLGRCRKKTGGVGGSEAGLTRIEQTIREALDDAKVDAKRLAGVGMGCPGPLDLDRGILLQATNLGWENVPIQDALQKALGCEVRIANDVDVGVYGEYRFGAGQSARSVIGVFPGTGIGGGCVYEGNLLRGSRSSCMEIGHMPVMVDGPLCGCGNRGCLEAVASRLAISSAATQAAFRGLAPNLLKAAGTDLANVRSGALAASIAAGDRAIEDIVRHAARMIGMAVGGLVNLLAPDRVVLGGGMVEAMPDLFIAEISTTARNRAMPAYAGTTQFAVAQLGDDAGVLGAAAWAQHCIAPAGE